MMKLRALVFAFLLGLNAAAHTAPPEQPNWVGAWATSQLVPSGDNVTPPEDLTDATLRQVVRVTSAGKQMRVRLSNAFGQTPLVIGAVTVALSADHRSSRVNMTTLRPLTFGGERTTVIPAGADIWSDPVSMPLQAGADVAITLYLPKAPDRLTGHPGSRATSYFARGDRTADEELTAAKAAPRWLVIGGVEVDVKNASALVILGDSITDGYGVQPDTNMRWPDRLFERMHAAPETRNIAVLNAGIGGNRLRLDGLGPNALARFDRDVLSVPGVSHLIVIEGVNDLGTLTRDAPATPEQHAALVREMIEGLRQIVARARAHNIKAIGGTIMSFGGSAYYHPDAANEADREAVNAWIRAPGNFDAVIDFDAALRDPNNPTRLRTDLDSGDGLHPSMAGYGAMADAVRLSILSGQKPSRTAAPANAKLPLEPIPEIAFTFDDLPVHAPLPPGETRVSVAKQIIAALKKANAPATGFINAAHTEREPASEEVLDLWRAAGLPLGNHGWSHANLNSLSDEAFTEELTKNEAVLKAKMGNEDWHWFRYPFLAEGKDADQRERIRKILAAKQYKVAGVTMDFGDWAHNDAYARCAAKGDKDAIARMETDWLAGAQATARRSRAMAQKLYGRDIPYVLLMHVGAFDGHMMPRLIELYQREGFRFVTLEQATKDPHYRNEIDPALPAPQQYLEGALGQKGLDFPPERPRMQMDNLCL
jgi:lysophospholipase L1-like esterase